MLEIFTTNKYDNRIAVIDDEKSYTISDLKGFIASEAELLKTKKDNVVLLGDDNFAFIIQFFASVFTDKNIYLITDKTRLKTLDFEYDVLNGYENTKSEFVCPEIDIKKPNVNFYTSGSSGVPKVFQKSLFNLIREAEDLGKEFGFKDKEVVSTTIMSHLFGLTFHFMMSFFNGLVINTQRVFYPDNLDKKNCILVSTPTFLGSIPKYDIQFTIPPEYIITAGSKLDEQIFKFLEEKTNVIEIYGSTETGVMAHKEHYDADFKLFDEVELKVNEDSVEVVSDYFYGEEVIINDKVEVKDRMLTIKNRTDRLFKINEKRISAEELENDLKLSSLVSNSYITKSGSKLVCLCALSKEGQDYLLNNNITSLTKTLKKHLSNYSEIVPQKWKYIDEIPMTQTGKINKKTIEHIFNVNLSLPVILERKLCENTVTLKIFFYNQCNFFKGHFPQFKLVPGVLQLYLAKEIANSLFNLELGEGQWKRIKFSNVIVPDSIVSLKLTKTDKNVSYEYSSESKHFSSGVFLCENIFKEV